jgi:flagellar hook-basal body complex protein FliE
MASPLNAVAAYANTARAGLPGMPAGGAELLGKSADPTFSNLVEQAAGRVLEISHNAEQVSAQAVVGKADLNDVVSAVANAEVTLQTVVAVRDRVVSAYQDIMRMPI